MCVVISTSSAIIQSFSVIALLILRSVIFSYSLSSLMAIHNWHLEKGYVQKFISDYSQLVKSGKTVAVCWIPSHVGI